MKQVSIEEALINYGTFRTYYAHYQWVQNYMENLKLVEDIGNKQGKEILK